MLTNPFIVIGATSVLILLSAFFVVVEFSLLGARRYRLKSEAAHSKTARAALKGVNQLTIMLAGAQLGITACTFALGAVTKPAVDKFLNPILESWGLPEGVAGTASFVLSLTFVTFLHLVVGEMAPKSWAIAHPEKSAKLIGVPAQIYLWFTKPLLVRVNNIANRLVSASGVAPVNRAAVGGQDTETIRLLVEHSANAGTLEPSLREQLSEVLGLENLTAGDLIADRTTPPTTVPNHATVRDVREAVKQSHHMRILVRNDTNIPDVIHVRNTLLQPANTPVKGLTRTVFTVSSDTKVYDVLKQMKQAGQQLAVVVEGDNMLGVITLSDIVQKVLPQRFT